MQLTDIFLTPKLSGSDDSVSRGLRIPAFARMTNKIQLVYVMLDLIRHPSQW
jgi:hypothetical protein